MILYNKVQQIIYSTECRFDGFETALDILLFDLSDRIQYLLDRIHCMLFDTIAYILDIVNKVISYLDYFAMKIVQQQ